MRPTSKRPVRKQEIQFKKSLFRFTAIFCLVFVSGLVCRLLLQQIPLKEKLTNQLSFPESTQLTLDDVSLQVRDGWQPVLGIAINRLDWVDKSCPSQKLSAQDVLIQADVWGLLFGELKVGELKVDYLDINLSKACPVQGFHKNQVATPSYNLTKKDEKLNKVTAKTSVLWSDAFVEIKKNLQQPQLKKIIVDHIQVNFLESLHKQVRASGSFRGRIGDNISGELSIRKLFFGQSDLSYVTSKVKVEASEQEVSFQWDASVREGKLSAHLLLENGKDYQTKLHLESKKIPLSALSDIFSMGVDIGYLWFSCSVDVASSPWEQLRTQKMEWGKCLVAGPYGQIQLQEIKANLQELSSFKATMDKIILNKVLRNKRDTYFSGVFSNYGQLSSYLEFDQGEWLIKGLLSDAELIFSNNNLRDIQKVKRLPFLIQSNQKKWTAKIENVELSDGFFDGELKLTRDSQNGKSYGRVAVHKMTLNPRVYKLMLSSEPSPLQIYGKFSLLKNKVDQWSAVIATPYLKSEYYDFRQLKVKAQSGSDDVAQVQISMGRGGVATKSPLFGWISPTSLDATWAKEKVLFKELSVKIGVASDRSLFWKRGYTLLKNGWQLTSEGERSPTRQVSAWLQWDRPDHKFMKWNFDGPFFEGQWAPETPWVLEWLNQHPDFLKTHNRIQVKGS